MKKTDSILNSDYEGCVCIIEENITSESFEALMAHAKQYFIYFMRILLLMEFYLKNMMRLVLEVNI